MQRVSRRSFLALATFTTAGSVLGACQASSPVAPAPAATGVPNAAAPSTANKAVTLNWITPGEIGLERDFYSGFAQEFEQAHPGTKIEVSFEAWADYFTKLPTIFAGGSIPDIIHLHISTLQEYGLRGAVRDLMPYLKKDSIPIDMYFPFLIDKALDYKTRTKLWGLPKDSAVYAVYYNKDLFDKAKVPYPNNDWTFAEFRETAKRVTLDKNGRSPTDPQFDPNAIVQWGMAWGNPQSDSPLPTSDMWQSSAMGVAGPWYTSDFSQASFDDPDHVDFVQQVTDMRCKDHSMPLAGEMTAQGDSWRNGLTAMTIGHHSQVFFYKAEKKTFPFDVVFPPGGKRGQFQSAGFSAWAIPEKAPHPDEAWEFVKFLCSEPVQTKITAVKRWGSSVVASESQLMPDDGIPKNFKEVLLDPMQGNSKMTTFAIAYPPLISDLRQVWKTEYDPVFDCGGQSVADASKRAQPQIQAVLDRAARM